MLKFGYIFSLSEKQFYSKSEEELGWNIVEPGAIVPFTFNEHGIQRIKKIKF